MHTGMANKNGVELEKRNKGVVRNKKALAI